MRSAIALFLIFAVVANIRASAESENEPSAAQFDVLSKAISASPIKSYYSDKEKTSYYLRNANFVARIKTSKAYFLVFRFTFIRSSPYRKDAVTPPRGHTFILVFNDSVEPLWHREIDMPDDFRIDEAVLKADGQWSFNLHDLPIQKTEQGAAANP